ncbi:conserved unknown protein [Ectocarpus siliculosus]|uniref:Uncharacterized protein n=1 Tax=Ectocarpus siliculosus TaxID=2880 RepID=D7FVW2_ECTSI|nr:conserved unknown protein [Ectocarpus siliculosus]|eukprot:CBJ25482.1 conserved unknown protein [Ectocarpus siliculosus]
MTRPERRALKDKVALEKGRLMQRAGQAAKMNRDNLPPEGVSLTECTPDAAGFIADADRFHSDTVGEEHLRRKAQHERKVQINDNRRQLRVEREGKRWEDMEKKEGDDEQRWNRLRDEGEKSKKNKSGVPYNMISLRYNDGLDGDRLEYADNVTKHRAQVRSNNLTRLGDSRCGYNILTGQPREEIVDPPVPKPSDAVALWSHHQGGR